MSKGFYFGVDDAAHKSKKMYYGVNGVARKAKKAYIGVPLFERRELPTEYTQVEYIENTGAQYINTGFVPNQDTRIVISVQLVNTSDTNQWIYCGRTGTYDSAMGMFFFGNGNYGAAYGTEQNTAIWTLSEPTMRIEVDQNKNNVNLNGESYSFNTASFTSAAPITLLARNTSGTIAEYAYAKLFSCQIYDDGTLVRDYVPCVDANGIAGLYDLVNSSFVTSASAEAFTAGSEYKCVARMFYSGGVEFRSYSGDYTTSNVTIDGVSYTLYTLISTGTLVIDGDGALAWMCGGGGNGGTSSGYISGGGGGGGYVNTGAVPGGTHTVIIGAARGVTSIDDILSANNGADGNGYVGGDGGSGGGSGGRGSTASSSSGTVGKGDGVSTIPFGLSALKKHCAGGGGGTSTDIAKNVASQGGNGGSNGGNGKHNIYHTSLDSVSASSGGSYGGGNGGMRTRAPYEDDGVIIESTAGSFYGAGGGGELSMYTNPGFAVGTGGAGYQGVVYIAVPA